MVRRLYRVERRLRLSLSRLLQVLGLPLRQLRRDQCLLQLVAETSGIILT